MNKLWHIARNDLRLIFKEKDIWINLVVIPLVLSYVIGIASGASGGAQTVPTLLIDVFDADQSALSTDFLNGVRAAHSGFILCPLDQTEDDVCRLEGAELTPEVAQSRLEDKVVLVQLEIPAGFESQIAAGESVSVIYRSNETAAAPSYILQAVQAVTQKLGGALTAARVGTDVAIALDADVFADDPTFGQAVRDRAAEVWATDPITIERVDSSAYADSQPSAAQRGFGQSVPGMASMYVMFAIFPAATAILLERKQWTLQRLTTMPISRTQILGGKLLARFVVGMLQYAIVFAFGAVIGVRYGSDPLAIVVLMVSFVVCITALTLAITTLIKNAQQANGITLFLTLTLAPLGGAWWSLEIVPAFMRTLGHVSPVAWAMDGYTSLLFLGGNLGTILPSIVVLLVMAAVFFVFGVIRFKFD